MTTPTPKAFVVTKDDLDVLNANIAYARQQGDLAGQAVAQLMELLGKGKIVGGAGTGSNPLTNYQTLQLTPAQTKLKQPFYNMEEYEMTGVGTTVRALDGDGSPLINGLVRLAYITTLGGE